MDNDRAEPRRCRRQVMTLARRHSRRKYGVSSSARHTDKTAASSLVFGPLGSAERQEQRPPFLGADRHGGDPVAVDAGLMMQEAQHGSRQGEVEPRRPGAGAEPELFPEMIAATGHERERADAASSTEVRHAAGITFTGQRSGKSVARRGCTSIAGPASPRILKSALAAAPIDGAPREAYNRARRAFAA